MAETGAVILWDFQLGGNFYPLTLSRPPFELLTGCFRNRERDRLMFPKLPLGVFSGEEKKYIPNKQNLDFYDPLSLAKTDADTLLILNAGVPLTSSLAEMLAEVTPDLLVHTNEYPLALKVSKKTWLEDYPNLKGLSKDMLFQYFRLNFTREEVEYFEPRYLFNLMLQNPSILEEDLKLIEEKEHLTSSEKVKQYNPSSIYKLGEVEIAPFTLFDAREGPIVLGEGAKIGANSTIKGPCFLGKNTVVMSNTKIREGCSFGPQCRLGGEIEQTIMQGYSNKYHTGFLGHSYIGEWVNLGALTTNSDLKNNYSDISITLNGKDSLQTGSNKIGCFIGDHTKLGIGTLINTGGVIGFSANFYGGGVAPKFLPSFIWGSKGNFTEYKHDKFLETARTVMARRDKKLTETHKELYQHIREITLGKRGRFLKKD